MNFLIFFIFFFKLTFCWTEECIAATEEFIQLNQLKFDEQIKTLGKNHRSIAYNHKISLMS